MALIRDYRVAWEAAVGLADREEGKKATAETLFQAGSISKPVAAAAVLREAEKGTAPSRRGRERLPQELEAARERADRAGEGHAGAHPLARGRADGSRLSRLRRGRGVPTVPQVLDGAPPANTAPVRVDLVPGSRWRYSGGGYTIAQLAMSDTLGQEFPDLMRALCLAPAGMSFSTYEQPLPASRLVQAAAGYRRDGSPVPGKRHVYPEMAAAGLWTTAGDLARFAVAIQKSLRGDAGSLLSPPTAERMVTPVHRKVRPRLRRRDARERALLQPRRRGRGLPGLPRRPPRRLGRRGHGQLGQWGGARGRDPPRPRPAGRLERLPPRAARARRPAFRRSAGGGGTLPGERRRGRLGRASRRPRLRSQSTIDAEFELFPVEGDRLARRDRATLYGVLRSDGTVRALTIETDETRSEAPRMPPDEAIPVRSRRRGEPRGGDERLQALRRESRTTPASREARLNRLGYQLAGRQEQRAAIIVLQVNTVLHPDSANTWDSLGEVLLRDGQPARALESYRKVVEVLPRDKGATRPRSASCGRTPSARSRSWRPIPVPSAERPHASGEVLRSVASSRHLSRLSLVVRRP